MSACIYNTCFTLFAAFTLPPPTLSKFCVKYTKLNRWFACVFINNVNIFLCSINLWKSFTLFAAFTLSPPTISKFCVKYTKLRGKREKKKKGQFMKIDVQLVFLQIMCIFIYQRKNKVKEYIYVSVRCKNARRSALLSQFVKNTCLLLNCKYFIFVWVKRFRT